MINQYGQLAKTWNSHEKKSFVRVHWHQLSRFFLMKAQICSLDFNNNPQSFKTCFKWIKMLKIPNEAEICRVQESKLFNWKIINSTQPSPSKCGVFPPIESGKYSFRNIGNRSVHLRPDGWKIKVHVQEHKSLVWRLWRPNELPIHKASSRVLFLFFSVFLQPVFFHGAAGLSGLF